MDEQIFPVCSPAWLARNGPLADPHELAGKALIHDLSVDTHIGFASWGDWLARAGAPEIDTDRGMRVNNSAAVLQAAIDGHGIALARSVMACDDVVAGRLVRLFPKVRLESELAYYIVYRQESAALPKLAAFRNWLKQETPTPC
jgi:LysR family glycine cleavage system transcriptional activator